MSVVNEAPRSLLSAPLDTALVGSRPPLKRFRANVEGPPLWSAEARWTDLTIRREVLDTAPPPSGWGQDWTVSYRHGRHRLTDSVASVATGDLLVADPVRVNSWHPNKKSRAGLRYLHVTDRHHAHESLFERKLLSILDFDGATEVVAQPFTLSWHDGTRTRHHTPDFLALIDGQIVIINTRPEPKVDVALMEDAAAVAEVAVSRGWWHALVVGYCLPGFTTIDTVEAKANADDWLGYRTAILSHLEAAGPTPLAKLCQQFEGYVIARAIVQRLLWDREVSIDLNRPMEDWSLIALPGQEDQR